MAKKKKKSNYLPLAMLVLIIAAALILSLMFGAEEEIDEYAEYGSFEFIQDSQGFWTTTMNTAYGENQITFRLHPKDVDQILYNNTINAALAHVQRQNGNVLIGIDNEIGPFSRTAIAVSEISKIMGNVFAIPTKTGVIYPEDDLPVHNCELNASQSTFVFELRKSDEPKIVSDGFCAILYGEGDNLIELSNAIVYRLTGVIQ